MKAIIIAVGFKECARVGLEPTTTGFCSAALPNETYLACAKNNCQPRWLINHASCYEPYLNV